MAAFNVIMEVWPAALVIIGLVVINFLRALAYSRRNDTERHDLARAVYKARMDYERELEESMKAPETDENGVIVA